VAVETSSCTDALAWDVVSSTAPTEVVSAAAFGMGDVFNKVHCD